MNNEMYVEFVEIDSGFLECKRIRGTSETRPTMIFLHEGLGCVALWRDFPEKLVAATGWNALVYSRNGYGKSSTAKLPRSTDFMHHEAELLGKLVSYYAIKDFIVIGHSDGASIALLYAANKKSPAPRGILLEAPHVFVEECCLKAIKGITAAYQSSDLRERMMRYHGDNTDCAFRGWSGVWMNPSFRTWNIEMVLVSISVPVLLIQGKDDQYGTELQVEAVKKGVPGPVEVVLMNECGHSPHREQEKITLEAMEKFIAKLL